MGYYWSSILITCRLPQHSCVRLGLLNWELQTTPAALSTNQGPALWRCKPALTAESVTAKLKAADVNSGATASHDSCVALGCHEPAGAARLYQPSPASPPESSHSSVSMKPFGI